MPRNFPVIEEFLFSYAEKRDGGRVGGEGRELPQP